MGSEAPCSESKTETSVAQHIEPRQSGASLRSLDFLESTAHLPCGPCGWLGLLLTKLFLTLLTKVNNSETKWCGAKGQWMAKELSTGLPGSCALLQELAPVLSQSCSLLQAGSSVSKPGWGLHVKTGTNISL